MYKSVKGKKRRKCANGEDILQYICELKERGVEEIFIKDRQFTFHYKKTKKLLNPHRATAIVLRKY